ncbi:MAG: GTPase ObgE, partial [Methylocystis sp.]
GLESKPEVVALSKTDAVEAEHLKKQRERLMRAIRSAGPETEEKVEKPLLLSAVNGDGVKESLRALQRQIDAERVEAEATQEGPAWSP